MTAALTIRRLRVACDAPGGADAPRLESRLADCARRQLPQALRDALAAAPPDWRGGGVLLIRRVELDFDLDVAADADTLGAVWARALARAAFRTGAGRDTVRFAGEADYLAAFVADMAAGRAWRWYFAGFEGLRALERPAMLRTALLRDADTGARALGLLSPAVRAQVIGALSPRGAAQLAEALIGAGGPGTPPLPAGFARALAHDAFVSEAASPAHQALILAFADADSLAYARGIGAPLLLAYAALVQALQVAGRGGRAAVLRLAAAGGAGDTARRGLPVALAAALQALSPPGRAALAAMIAQAQAADVARRPPPPARADATRFGGAFLLWPMIRDLPLDAVCEWPPLGRLPAPQVLRWLVLGRAFGRDAEPGLLADPLLSRLLIGPRPPGRAEAQGWLAETLASRGDTAVLAALDAWFPDEGVRKAERREVPYGAAELPLFKGDAQGYWLRLGRAGISPLPEGEVPGKAGTDVRDLAALVPDDPPDGAGLLLAQLAQIAVKRLLYRIPGYANSSLDYAWRNFLSMAAAVEEEERRLLVTLGPTPLSLMLNMTGLGRQSVPLGPDEPRPAVLCQEGA